jgi:hypothetical protein
MVDRSWFTENLARHLLQRAYDTSELGLRISD